MLAPSVEDEIIFGLENLGLDRQEIRRRRKTIIPPGMQVGMQETVAFF
jgi:energy-coupling factor transporter ATP-binding protein EcfA2